MAGCRATQGFNFDCNSLKRVSGVRRVWFFNLEDLASPIDPNGTGFVGSLEFDSYDGLYEVESRKLSHQFTHNLVISEGGSASFTQTGVLNVFVDTPAEVAALADLAVANVGFVVLTNNSEFRIYGAENGMNAGDGTTGTTGRQMGENTTDQITMIGSERLPYRILTRGDFNSTLQYVEALEF